MKKYSVAMFVLFVTITAYSQTYTYSNAEYNTTSQLRDSTGNYSDSVLYLKKKNASIKFYTVKKTAYTTYNVQITFDGETETYHVSGDEYNREYDEYGREKKSLKTFKEMAFVMEEGCYIYSFNTDSDKRFEALIIDENTNTAKLVVSEWTESGKIRNIVLGN